MVIMIILLILCLPLILMFSLFTATEVVSIMVDVPVNSIDVLIEELVELDLDRGESIEVDYVIGPTEAGNKDVSFYFSPLGTDKLATFTVDGNKLTPTSYGSAHVTVETVDGGYRDSFDVVVYSKVVESITSTVESNILTIGESTQIRTSYYPAVVRDDGLIYRVKEGEDTVTVSKTGLVRAIGIGTAVIEVISGDNPAAVSEVTLTVRSSGVIDYVSDRCDITALDDTAKIQAVINPELTVYSYTLTLYHPDGSLVDESIAVATLDTATGLISCHFTDGAFVGDIEISLYISTSGGDVQKSCYVHRISEIEIGWGDDSSDGRYVVFGSDSDGERIEIGLRPIGADVSYFITLNYTASNGVYDDTPGTSYVVSGVEFELVEGNRYVARDGTVSLELESTADGVFLVVRGERIPSLDEVNSGVTVTEISLTVVNNHNGSVTVLNTVSVVVY